MAATTVAIPAGSNTALDTGSSAGLDLVNTGSAEVLVATGPSASSFGSGTHVVRPRQYVFVTTGGLPVLAKPSGSVAGEITSVAIAQPTSGAGSSVSVPSYPELAQLPGGPGNATDPAPTGATIAYVASIGQFVEYHPPSGLWLTLNGSGLLVAKQWLNDLPAIGGSATVWGNVCRVEYPAGLPIRVELDSKINVAQGSLAQLADVAVQLRLVDIDATSTSYTTLYWSEEVWTDQWASVNSGTFRPRLKVGFPLPMIDTRASTQLQALVTASSGGLTFKAGGGVRTVVDQ